MTHRLIRTGDSRVDLVILAAAVVANGSGPLSLDRMLARKEVA